MYPTRKADLSVLVNGTHFQWALIHAPDSNPGWRGRRQCWQRVVFPSLISISHPQFGFIQFFFVIFKGISWKCIFIPLPSFIIWLVSSLCSKISIVNSKTESCANRLRHWVARACACVVRLSNWVSRILFISNDMEQHRRITHFYLLVLHYLTRLIWAYRLCYMLVQLCFTIMKRIHYNLFNLAI